MPSIFHYFGYFQLHENMIQSYFLFLFTFFKNVITTETFNTTPVAHTRCPSEGAGREPAVILGSEKVESRLQGLSA